MPAFKFTSNNSVVLVNDINRHVAVNVDILLRGGSTNPVLWLGFIGNSSLSDIPSQTSRFAKMRALAVTGDAGSELSSWRSLLAGEFVLSRLVLLPAGLGVYTILDMYGCPIVKGFPQTE